jgi:hypothetical protein
MALAGAFAKRIGEMWSFCTICLCKIDAASLTNQFLNSFPVLSYDPSFQLDIIDHRKTAEKES